MKTSAPILFVLAVLLTACATSPAQRFSSALDALPSGVQLTGPGTLQAGPVVLTSPYLGQGVKLRGTLGSPREDGSRALTLETLEVFLNWAQGWTEGEWTLAGEARLLPEAGSWKLTVQETPRILEVLKASLRYKDKMIRGDQAQKYLRDRWDRVKAGAEMVSTSWFEAPRGYWSWIPLGWQPRFEDAAGKLLFPEVYGGNPAVLQGSRAEGEGLSWDKDYTAEAFPVHLHEVRNTGTLYRDWEEGLDLWFLAAQWTPFWEQKMPSAVFHLQQ